jgi:hypothetical protein
MKTLYDVIGALPDDDAENIKKAYRQAAKANHPDHHDGDPEAARRFRRITAAYDILRDAEQRVAYDQLLDARRRPLRARLKRAILEVRRHAVYDAAAAAAITAILICGYAAVSHVSTGPYAEAETAGVTEREPARSAAAAAADQDAGARRNRGAAPQMPIVTLVAAGVVDTSVANDRVPEGTKGESAPDAAGPAVTIAKRADDVRDDDLDSPINRPATTGAAGDTGNGPRPAPLERNKTPSVEVSSSGAERHVGRRGAWSSRIAASGERRDGRTSEARIYEPRTSEPRTSEPRTSEPKTSEPRTSEPKFSESKTSEPASVSAGPQASIRRQSAGRTGAEQAALDRNTPAGDVPPLFGVGF